MQYFSTELCKKLQDKGLESESGMYWCLDDHGTPYYELEESPIVAKWIKDGNIEAFIFQDLLTKENSIKLWGERTYIKKIIDIKETTAVHPLHTVKAHKSTVYNVQNEGWKKQSQRIFDLFQELGLESVEKYLMENL